MSRGGELVAYRFGEVGGGFLGGEPQVLRPDLDQLAPCPPPGQRQIGVGAGAEHDMDVRWQMLQQEGDPLADPGIADQVVVVEDQPHVFRYGAQLVEQRGEQQLRRHGCGGQELQQPACAQAGHGLLNCGQHVGPERGGFVVRGVEREPRDATSRPADPSCSHAARMVVLPNPAGADTRINRASAPFSSRSTSLGRATRPLRCRGAYSFVAINGRVTPASSKGRSRAGGSGPACTRSPCGPNTLRISTGSLLPNRCGIGVSGRGRRGR